MGVSARGRWPANAARNMRKKKKKFGNVKQARLRARETVGTPRPTLAVPSKKHKSPKHKKELIEREMEDD